MCLGCLGMFWDVLLDELLMIDWYFDKACSYKMKIAPSRNVTINIWMFAGINDQCLVFQMCSYKMKVNSDLHFAMFWYDCLFIFSYFVHVEGHTAERFFLLFGCIGVESPRGGAMWCRWVGHFSIFGGRFFDFLGSKNIFNPCSHIEFNTLNPNPILTITISFTKTQNTKYFRTLWKLLENSKNPKCSKTQICIWYYVYVP